MTSPFSTVKASENFYDEKSFILNPQKKFDSSGRPVSSKSFDFRTPKDLLKDCLRSLENNKSERKELREKWAYHQKARLLDQKEKMTGDFLTESNRLLGKKKVLEKECRLLNKSLVERETQIDKKLAKEIRKRKGVGGCSLKNGLIDSSDLRKVIYKKNIPIFEDDGSDVQEYLKKCRENKREKSRAAAKVLRL